MKNAIFVFFVTVFWLSFSATLTAQSLRFGLKAGAGVAKFDYESDTPTDSLDFFKFYRGPRNTANGSFKPTYTLCGVLEYDFSKAFVLSSGIQATLKFSQFRLQSVYAKNLNKYRFNVLYLQLPVTVHYRTGKFFLGAGGYAGWAVSGKWKNDVQDQNSVYQYVTDKIKFGNDPETSNLQRFDYGVRGEVGCGIKRLRLSFTFDQGIAKLKAANTKPEQQDNFFLREKGALRNQAIYVTATYYWLAK